jgi:hypothetical protein
LTFAQLTITNSDNGTPILDGDSFDFDTNVFEDAKLNFVISNTSDTETITVLGQMVSFTNTDGSNLQFCVNPECYFEVSPGETIPNPAVVLAPGENNGTFDYFSNTNAGDGENYPITYTLRFFMLDEEGNETGDDITITYNYTPESFSTSDFSLSDLGVELQNTVVSENLKFTTVNNIDINIYDLNGKQVDQYNLKAGNHNINLSNYSVGNYVVKFSTEQGKHSITKIVKQ